ncbi:family 43 glycosylhydrolase [Paenibacillus sp. LHD-38]|uniref:family 43 glycosylhydrolase n=1 Tax=Paenibacillus sp. LHD-38 TaxID=3072143 RepID=UPI00280D96F4|nr:family 43 glycosylhydrolase [Paenibacillus sp. LHD-38]MDQ8735671.1 family 43 glycosylhydrolase [Paenibacillus sp. LHD-38]
MFKKSFSFLLALTLFLNLVPSTSVYAQQGESMFENPFIWADVPDLNVIRVGDAYYMSSTTMHMNPGVPIMKSYDLVNWEIVNYVYDILADNDEQALRNGKSNYGQGSWASSLRYHNGKFYVAFPSYDTGKTYIYQTEDIEKGPWTHSTFDGVYHDMSLLFDDDGRVYMVYGGGDIKAIELTSDATAIKPGGLDKIIIPNASLVAGPNVGLNAEGTHIQKINGSYYVFNITWPKDGMRTQIVHRADAIDGTYRGQVALRDAGIAQGGIVDSVDGKWYGMLFGDRGSVGRIPYLIPVTWEDGWPIFGVDGKVPQSMPIPVNGVTSKNLIVDSDEFYQRPERVGASHTVFGDTANIVSNPSFSSSQTAADPAAQTFAAANEGQEILVNGGFEAGQEPWTGHENATVTASTYDAYSGSSSLFISNRQATGAGPQHLITGKVKAGGVYEFSARVKYDGNSALPATKQFNFAIQDGDWTTIKVLGSATVNKGEWGTIEGTYTIPEEAVLNEPLIFIETVWTPQQDPTLDLMDFYVDDVSLRDVTPDSNLLVNGGFENGREPWSGHENAAVAVTADEAFSGSSSLYISNRQATGAGPQQSIAGKVKAGGVYKFSAKVKYDGDSTLPATKQFNFDIQDGDWTTIKVLGSGTVSKGEWGTIEGTYMIPDDAELHAPIIFMETPWTPEQDPVKDLMNFYVDDVSLEDVTPAGGLDKAKIGEYDYNGSNLSLVWQWNLNPDNRNWSLTERPGYLRLTTGRKSTNLLDARNTLTQRTFGPESSGSIAVDISQMKNGDYAGLAALQKEYGYVGVKMSGTSKSIVMVDGSSETAVEVASVPVNEEKVYFKIELDYKNQTDKAYFYYSLNGADWTAIGNTLQMHYTLPHFMGYRFALFNYATKTTGGSVDFDYFRVDDKMTGSNASATILNAELGDVTDVIGVQNMELEVPLKMDALPSGQYTSISASFNIPKYLSVTGVEFNSDNIVGDPSFTYADNRLQVKVSGENVNFTHQASDLFATIKLKVEGFVPTDQTVAIQTDYIQVEGGNIGYNVHEAVANVGLKKLDTGAIAKIPGYSNPLMDHKLGADPYALAYNGRVYIYMSSDDYEYDSNGNVKDNSFSNLNRVFVISSDDMVNWTDHGAIPVAGPAGIAKWATFSWAPAAANKQIDGKDKFFLYFANGAGGIGVLTADSPIGPWTDPLGKALITGNTPGVPGVVWLFDPAVLVDDDGKGYLYFGGGIPGGNNPTQEQVANPRTGRVMELGDDMVSTVGEAALIDAPFLFEDSGIHKYNGKYYYSYCSNFAGTHPEGTPPPGEIAYMVSDNPMGPFTYVSPILKNPYEFFGVGGNNHHAIFEFNNEWYAVYHAQTVSKALLGDGKGYRSPHINRFEFYENGLIKDIKGDMEGISQIADLDPYKRTESETIAWNGGILTEKSGAPGSLVESVNLHVTDIDNGDWLAVANADFGEKGAASFEANIAAAAGGTIEIRLDSPIGKVIGTLDIAAAGGVQVWQLLQTNVDHVKGIHNVFFMFKGAGTSNLFNMDYWKFTAVDPGPDVTPVQSVSITSEATGVKVGETLTVGSTINPSQATNPIYQWTSSGKISIVGDSNKASVAIKGVSAGTGTLTLTVTAGGSEKKAEMEFTVTSSNNGGDGTPTAPPVTGNTVVDILINGKAESAGTAVKSERNGQTVTTIAIDQIKLVQWLAAEGDQARITIPVNSESDIVALKLNAQMAKEMESKKAVLEIQTNRATYTVPAQQIDSSAISKQFGASVALKDMTIQIEIAVPDAAMAELVENEAIKGEFTLVAPPINFTVTAQHGNKIIEISKFNAYVERMIAIPDGVAPNKLTTVVVVEQDGTVRHVPTKIITIEGKLYAKVNSLTNSTYAVIYHPVEFSDVAQHWAKDAVNDLGSRMVITGIGNDRFNPSADITRAEFAAIVVRGLGLKQENGTTPFPDVKAKDWYSSAIVTAQSYNLINGFEDGTFRPQDKITREQAMVIIAKAMTITGLKANLENQTADVVLRPYKDAADASSWAKKAIADSIQAEIVSGRSAAVLAPKAYITRAEVAKIVQQLLQKSDLT